LKLFLDNNLAPRIARSLHGLFDGEHHIVALRDMFRGNASDIEWITALDQQGGWAALTRDLHIRTRPHERAALDRARIVFFFLAGAWGSFSVEETAARLIRLVPRWRHKLNLPNAGVSNCRSMPDRSCDRIAGEEGRPCAADRQNRAKT
jgi:hypothetical protein